MARISYTHHTASGRTQFGVFDSTSADEFEALEASAEGTTEYLYRTDTAIWILNSIVVDAGGAERSVYETIPPDAARRWLADNNYYAAIERWFDDPAHGADQGSDAR
ncbi:hypothetical protein ACWDSJ_28415 [Nocardia sp. NPDC003482]